MFRVDAGAVIVTEYGEFFAKVEQGAEFFDCFVALAEFFEGRRGFEPVREFGFAAAGAAVERRSKRLPLPKMSRSAA